MEISQNIDIVVLVIWGIIFLYILLEFFRSIRLVPTKKAYIVEYLGKYDKTLGAGFHALVPFFHKVTFIQDLKEETIEVPPQDCFSMDEVNVEVDGVLYLSVIDPVKASYGITNYKFAAVQLAQTTTRSVIGTLDLDRTFEERDLISAKVVQVLNDAGETWGITVHRYEIKNLSPPATVRNAMEKQVTAERNRRAILARSEGEKQSIINRSEGVKAEMINRSEGQMQKSINEAEGKAAEILAISEATAESIAKIAAVVINPGGEDALSMQLGEKYLQKLQGLARDTNQIIVPSNLVDLKQWFDAVGLKFSNRESSSNTE